jgi:hypothetical protein
MMGLAGASTDGDAMASKSQMAQDLKLLPCWLLRFVLMALLSQSAPYRKVAVGRFGHSNSGRSNACFFLVEKKQCLTLTKMI